MIPRRILGILAIVLVALIALSWMTSQRRYAVTAGGGFADLMEGVDLGQISSVKAWLGEAADEAIELQRTSDSWIVASSWGWTAKDDVVQQLLADLGGLKGELRSSSADILGDFQIDETAGLHVVAKSDGGTDLFHFVVGKTAPRGGCFVRHDGSDDVYITQASLRSSFGVWGDEPDPPVAKRWIDLRIHRAERNDIDRVVIRGDEQELVLEKVFEAPAEEGGDVNRAVWTWKPDADGEFDKGKTDGIASTLCNLYANDVVEPGDLDRYGLGEGALMAEITFKDGTVMPVFFGSQKEGDDKFSYFRVGVDGDPAEIYQSTVDRVFLERSELNPAEE